MGNLTNSLEAESISGLFYKFLKKNSENFEKIYLFDPWLDLHGVSMAFFHQSVGQDQEQFDFFPRFFGLFFEAVVLLQEELGLFLGLAHTGMGVR